MYDVDILEKEWKRYKIKQTLPWIGGTFVLSLIFIYILNRDYIFNEIKKFLPEDKNITEVVAVRVAVTQDIKPTVIEKIEKVEKEEKPEKCIEVNTSQVPKVEVKTLAQNSATIKEREIVNDTEYNEEIDKEIDNINTEKPKMNIEFAKDSEVVEENNQNTPHRRKYLNIIVTDKDSLNEDSSKIFDTLSIVENRYNKNNNYQDALYLAEGYYQQGEYDISQKWSLVSNNLNSNSEESWLIFAKSKAKLGEYKVAEDILEAYLKENSSKKAEKLLEMMQLGKF